LYNANGQLPTDLPQTFQAAELYAVKMAVETLRDNIFTSAQHKGINQVFMLTESKYIKESLSKDIWKWESNNYVTARKTPVANSDALKEVHELIKGFEANGTAVLFWVVERKYNKDAAGLAREALGVEEDEVQEAKKKSSKKKPKNKPDSDSEMGREKKPDKGKGKEKDEDAPDCDYIPGFNPLELYTGNMNLFGGYGLSRDNINNVTASTAKLYRGPDNHL
jgi:ribonuclease HI